MYNILRQEPQEIDRAVRYKLYIKSDFQIKEKMNGEEIVVTAYGYWEKDDCTAMLSLYLDDGTSIITMSPTVINSFFLIIDGLGIDLCSEKLPLTIRKNTSSKGREFYEFTYNI